MFLPYHPELAMFQCGYGPDINVLYHISTRLPRHKGWIFVQNLETNSAPAPSVAYLVELCFFAEYYTYIGINLIKILPYLRAVTEFHQVFSLHCRRCGEIELGNGAPWPNLCGSQVGMCQLCTTEVDPSA